MLHISTRYFRHVVIAFKMFCISRSAFKWINKCISVLSIRFDFIYRYYKLLKGYHWGDLYTQCVQHQRISYESMRRRFQLKNVFSLNFLVTIFYLGPHQPAPKYIQVIIRTYNGIFTMKKNGRPICVLINIHPK